MKFNDYKGLIAAGFTPFTADGSLAIEKIPQLVDFAVASKLSGLFVCGSTGEFASMTSAERMLVAEAYLKSAAGRIPIIVHVGSCSITESALLARHAAENGAAAVSALAPFYFRTGGNVGLLVRAMAAIAASVPKLPFYYYHMPAATGAAVAMNDFLPQAEKEIPNLAGVKFTHEDLMDYQRSVDYAADRMQIMFGRDEILLSALAAGAVGAVGSTYNYAAWIYHRVIAAYGNGNMDEARRWQALSQKLVGLLQKFGPGAQKALMKVAGADAGYSRLPLPDLDEQAFSELKREAEVIFSLKDR